LSIEIAMNSTNFRAICIFALILSSILSKLVIASPPYVEPVAIADWIRKDETITKISLFKYRRLIPFESCKKFPQLETDMFKAPIDYSNCPHTREPGQGAVLRVSEDTVSINTLDRADAVVLSLYWAKGFQLGVFKLPSQEARATYSSCKYNPFRLAPCFVGNQAEGEVMVNRDSGGRWLVEIDLSITAADRAFRSLFGDVVPLPTKIFKLNRSYVIDPDESPAFRSP
jgi:hypothetical protein